MRVSTIWAQQLGINSLNDQYAKLTRIQQELSTGQKIISPADDPVGSVRVSDLQEAIARTEQYDRNINIIRPRLEREESALEETEEVVMRAQELTVEALNASISPSDRVAIKAEIDQLIEGLFSLANTRGDNGEYIFSGDLSNVPAYTFNTTSGEYDYTGGFDQRILQISPERRVPDGDLGFNVFSNLDSVSEQAEASVNGSAVGKRSLFSTLQSLSGALAGQFKQPMATLVGDRFMRYGADYSTPVTVPPTPSQTADFDITVDDGAGGSITQNIVLAGNYNTLEEVVNAINGQITALPAPSGDNMRAQVSGNQIAFVSLTEGAKSQVSLTENSGTFFTDFGFAAGSNDSAQGVDVSASITASKTHVFPSNYDIKPSSFELIANDGRKAVINLGAYPVTGVAHQNNAELIDDIATQIAASDLAGHIQINPTADPIVFEGVVPNGSTSVQIKQVTGTGTGFLDNIGVVSGELSRDFNLVAGDALTDLGSTLDHLVRVRASVGAKMNGVDDQEALDEKLIVDLKTAMSEIQDLDFAGAVSRYNVQQASFQAAQKAYAQVQNLSLFNFI